MARLGSAEAKEAAENLAAALDELRDVAIKVDANAHADGAVTINAVVDEAHDEDAAEQLEKPLEDAIEAAQDAPADHARDPDGDGTAPLHPDFVSRLTELGYAPQTGATQDNFRVTISVNEEGTDTLEVDLTPNPQNGDEDD